MFRKLCALIICSFILTQASAETADSVRAPHQLQGIEVLGLKEMPGGSILPQTRISQSEATKLGIETVRDVSDLVPNLFSPAYGSRMTSTIYMRGLGSRFDQAVVGLTVDGVPFLNKDLYDFDIPDINFIDVRRGAQSVLNGRNAMAGQVDILTISPRDFQGWRFMAEYGRANATKAMASGYFKLPANLYTSLTAQYAHTDGYWRNDYNGKLTGAENSGSLRWKLVWAPAPRLSLTNTAAMTIARQSGYPYADYTTGNICYNDTCFYRRSAFSDGLTLAWAGKRVVVTSLTSFQYLDDNLTLDQDFTSADYFTLTQARKEWAITEDIFAKGRRNKYQWMGGANFYFRHSKVHAPVTFFDTGIRELIEHYRNENNPHYPITWDERVFPLDCTFTTPSTGMALYHQSTFTAGRWTFEAGLRWLIERIGCRFDNNADAAYTIWQKEADGSTSVFDTRSLNIHDRDRLSQTYNQLLPKIVVSYRFDSGKIYAAFSKAYKSGGYNSQMFSDVLQQRVMSSMGLSMVYNADEIISYKPETSWNYELGASTKLFNDRLKAEAVLFLIDCRNQQLTVFPPGLVTGRIMTNAGRSRSLGAELTLNYSPTNNLKFMASWGYTNAKFVSYNNGKADMHGKRVPYAPANTIFASAFWTTPWHPAGLDTELGATLHGAGNIMWNEDNTLSQPFYVLPGASFTLRSARWSIKLWGENLSNTRYSTFYFLSMGNSFAQRGLPITFGATFRLNINS